MKKIFLLILCLFMFNFAFAKIKSNRDMITLALLEGTSSWLNYTKLPSTGGYVNGYLYGDTWYIGRTSSTFDFIYVTTSIYIDDKIYHLGDVNTYKDFDNDIIRTVVGGETAILLSEATTPKYIHLGSGSGWNDIRFFGVNRTTATADGGWWFDNYGIFEGSVTASEFYYNDGKEIKTMFISTSAITSGVQSIETSPGDRIEFYNYYGAGFPAFAMYTDFSGAGYSGYAFLCDGKEFAISNLESGAGGINFSSEVFRISMGEHSVAFSVDSSSITILRNASPIFSFSNAAGGWVDFLNSTVTISDLIIEYGVTATTATLGATTFTGDVDATGHTITASSFNAVGSAYRMNGNTIINEDGSIHAFTSNAVAVTVGTGAVGVDYMIRFNGETYDGDILWNENFPPDGRFEMSCGLVIDGCFSADSNKRGAMANTARDVQVYEITVSTSLGDTEDYEITEMDGKAGYGYVVALGHDSHGNFDFTTAGVVALKTGHNNLHTTVDNNTTLNISDSGTTITLSNELGGRYIICATIWYTD